MSRPPKATRPVPDMNFACKSLAMKTCLSLAAVSFQSVLASWMPNGHPPIVMCSLRETCKASAHVQLCRG